MYKLSVQVGNDWVEHSHNPVFKTQGADNEARRLVAGVPKGDSSVFRALVNQLTPPYFFLYVLHTSRGEGEPGRYQSPALERDEFNAFLDLYSSFWSGDGRHDVWAHSPSENATVVWDRHNLIFAYGPLDRFASALRSMGFEEGNPNSSFPHQHHYRQEFDDDATAILSAINWSRSPLCPSDEQWAEG